MADPGSVEPQEPPSEPLTPPSTGLPSGYAKVEDSDVAPPQGYSAVSDEDIVPPTPNKGYFGGRGQPIPQAVRDRLQDSDAITKIVNSTVSGLQDGYGPSATGLSTEVTDVLKRAGIFPRTAAEAQNPLSLRAWNQALLSPVAAVGDAFIRMFGAVQEGIAQGGGEAAQQLGLGDKGVAEEDIRGGFDWMLTRGDILDNMGRIEAGPGGHSDVRIGPLPSPDGPGGVPEQAQAVASHFGIPASAALVKSLYNDRGVLPAEVFHDAANNPEVIGHLAGGPVPGIYGGEPAAVTTLPIVAPEDFARISEEEALRETHAGVTAKLAALPEGDISAADRLNRLEAVEAQLKDENLAPVDRKALQNRRDQILVDTNPEALKAAAAPIQQRRMLEAQQAAIESRLAEIQPKPEPLLLHGERPQGIEPQGEPTNEPLRPLPSAAAEGPLAVPTTPPEVRPVEAPTTAAAEEAATAVPGAPTAAPRVAATALRPIEGTGEVRPFALAESTEEAVDRSLGELPESKTAQDPVQQAAAGKLLAADPDRSLAIAMGTREPPKNLLRTAVYDAVLKDALAKGDYETIRQLGTQGAMPGIAKRFGQEISYLRNISENDPSSMIQEIQQARMAGREAQVTAETENAAQQVRAAKAASAARPDAWASFVNEIMCR